MKSNLFSPLAAISLLCANAQAQATARDLFADTWVATDALQRSLPDSAQVGAPREGKQVAMFYFLTFGEHPPNGGPYDNSKILLAHPEAINDINNPAWGPVGTAHHWGEPLFGYYLSDDPYVIRKHSQMLTNAGVDTIVFDVSNAVTYDRAYRAVCRVFAEIRREGGTTPQIAFLTPFGNPNGIGSRTVRSLYADLYKPGLYRDLWFEWKGKPLILARPESFAPDALQAVSQRGAEELGQGATLGQSFTVTRPFSAIGSDFPTYTTTGSSLTLALYADGPTGRLIKSQRFDNLSDNALLQLELPQTMPAGKYYLQISEVKGRAGWWGENGWHFDGGQPFENGLAASGNRALWIRFVGSATNETISPDGGVMTPEDRAKQIEGISNFFTVRAPIAPYNLKQIPTDSWSWLQIYPQMPSRDAAGNVEEVSVGVGQNYNATDNRTAPMSFPGAFGRSYHDGHLDTSPGAVNQGFNFAEQWTRAREIDPPLVFITGWNEWTAGRFNDWAGFKAPPVIFVDQFNQEFSRDIEPMRGGHGDDYYYQLVANVRRYKGARALPAVSPQKITLDGKFADWRNVGPEFRDAIGDPARRDYQGYGSAGPYRNATGRNDIVAAKVSYDATNVYFYGRTQNALTSSAEPHWMQLYIDADNNPKTGWSGYDFVVNRGAIASQQTTIQRNLGGKFAWDNPSPVRYEKGNNEMELAIPRAILGTNRTLDFKWADNCYENGEATDFTLNGDAAPDDRFNYRAKFAE